MIMTEENESTLNFQVGDRVQLTTSLPYVKTADPMPMLRPPNVVAIGEEGTVMDCRPGGYWGVRFKKGVFLMDGRHLEKVDDAPLQSAEPEASSAEAESAELESMDGDSVDVAG
jgi:hypothetical protein